MLVDFHNEKPSSQARSMLFVVLLLLFSLEVTKSNFIVKTLPGLAGDLPFKLETGYIGVGESDEVQMFYYFIESERNPKNDPLVLWMSGGPGCTSLYGLIYEIGPLAFNTEISTPEKPILEIVPDSLTKVASLIFLDQPAGSGFSYGKTPASYITNDTTSPMLPYNFLKKWLTDHPKFLKNPLYLGGDSYMGIILPRIVQEIYKGNEDGERPNINIKGYILGNPFTDRSSDYNAKIPFARNMALISEAIYQSTKENCNGEFFNVDPDNSLCLHDLQVVDKCIARIYSYHILEPFCEPTRLLETSNTLKSDVFRRGLRVTPTTSVNTLPQVQTQPCREDNHIYPYAWANRRDVREALHIHEEFNSIKWVECNESLQFDSAEKERSYTHNVLSSVDYHQSLTDNNCRALIYSGDHDMTVPYLSTLNWIESLNLPVVDDWRPWSVDEQVAGYTKKYSKDDYNLTFATVKGGGHIAPQYKHKECLRMLIRWLANDTL